MKVAITGATGFVGSRLVEKLNAQGDTVLVFTRDAQRGRRVFPAAAFEQVEIVAYTPKEAGEWQGSISGCDAVVNLAGAPIADERWTPQRKKEILESRQRVTRNLVEAMKQATDKPGVLVNASAVGYYGTSETATFDENSSPGNDFLAEVCQIWEAEAQKVKEAGVRLAIIRFGIVLGEGGAIAKMITPFRFFTGGPLGSGRQWFSWIHRDDLVNLILEAIKREDISGVYNGTAPNPVRMHELCHQLGEVMHRPSWLPVPDFALHALLGDAADVILEGQQVLPKNTQATGFTYQFENVKPALADIVAKL